MSNFFNLFRKKHQSMPLFCIFSLPISIFFCISGSLMAYSTIKNKLTGDKIQLVCVSIFFLLMGIGLFAGSIFAWIYFFKELTNHNAGKQAINTPLLYELYVNGKKIEFYNDVNEIYYYVSKMTPADTVEVILDPEFFDLKSWKFTKVKNAYFSFVTIKEKKGYSEYFIMPRFNANEAFEFFKQTFTYHKAVDTTILIDMKRYYGVLQVYHLFPVSQNPFTKSNNNIVSSKTNSKVQKQQSRDTKLSPKDQKHIKQLLQANQKIVAIKYVKDSLNVGLSEAKDIIDNF